MLAIVCGLALETAAQVCFQPSGPLSPGGSPSGVVLGDVDGDGNADLVVTHSGPEYVGVSLGLGNGTFGPEVTYSTPDSCRTPALGDVDDDGDLDLGVACETGASLALFLNEGDGTFAPYVAHSTTTPSYSVTLVDLGILNDGVADAAVANTGGDRVVVFWSAGDGGFSQSTLHATGDAPRSIVAADLDGDGDRDLATANVGASTVSVLLNKGTGTLPDPFFPRVDYVVGSTPYFIAAGDLDADDDVDLVTANQGFFSNGTTVSVLLNTGNGTFAPHTQYPCGTAPDAVAVFDADLDGDLDLAVGLGSDNVVILANAGDASFGPPQVAATLPYAFFVSAGDVDGDGGLDLAAVSYQLGQARVYRNCGGTAAWTDLGLGKPGSAGVPELTGTGPLTAGSINKLILDDVPASAPTTLIIGAFPLMAPFKGGTLVPSPTLLVPLPANQAGELHLPFSWPGGVPAGVGLYFQFWIQDAGAFLGLSASNGLKGVAG